MNYLNRSASIAADAALHSLGALATSAIASLALVACAADPGAIDSEGDGDGMEAEDSAIEVAEQPFRAGMYSISAKHSGKCLDVTGASGADGAKLIQWSCNGQNNQRFQAVDVGGGEYALIALHSGKCLDVTGASAANGAQLIQFTCHFGDNQRFVVIDLTDGYSLIMPKHSGKCLDVSGGSVTGGAPIIQFACHVGPNQRFRFN